MGLGCTLNIKEFFKRTLRLPVYNSEGIPIPFAQVAHIDIIDDQTINDLRLAGMPIE